MSDIKPTIRATIVYLVDPVMGTVIMAKKMRKVGTGYWFGYGGKIEEGESPEECVVRETFEESGTVVIDPNHFQRIALIDFYKGDRPFGSPNYRVLCYRSIKWKGYPVGTPEMSTPTTFAIHNLPQAEMKPGDELFVPHILKGAPVKGWIRFSEDELRLLDHDIKPCSHKELVI